ncbi:hypothetical protein Zmor_024425 [Zophobas morio]|uniref:Uncharacterized protein n=1 Tax=Zophobas morio TaxID=2755281 RepID=A0AA38I518_9CUCU|nr:hypothetical protein Zmor_024425 [Zophobas morio]
MMHMQRSLDPRSSVPRLYFSRHRGGRGRLSLECMHCRVVLGLALKILKSSERRAKVTQHALLVVPQGQGVISLHSQKSPRALFTEILHFKHLKIYERKTFAN